MRRRETILIYLSSRFVRTRGASGALPPHVCDKSIAGSCPDCSHKNCIEKHWLHIAAEIYNLDDGFYITFMTALGKDNGI